MLQWTWGCTYHFKTVLWFPSWLRILWYIPRGGTAGSYGNSSFSFFEETFHSGGTNLHPQFLGCSFYFSFFFFVLHHTACGILIPYQGSNPRPLQWKLRVLTTGLSGKSMVAILYTWDHSIHAISYPTFLLFFHDHYFFLSVHFFCAAVIRVRWKVPMEKFHLSLVE